MLGIIAVEHFACVPGNGQSAFRGRPRQLPLWVYVKAGGDDLSHVPGAIWIEHSIIRAVGIAKAVGHFKPWVANQTFGINEFDTVFGQDGIVMMDITVQGTGLLRICEEIFGKLGRAGHVLSERTWTVRPEVQCEKLQELSIERDHPTKVLWQSIMKLCDPFNQQKVGFGVVPGATDISQAWALQIPH